MLVGEAERILGQLILPGEGCPKHGWIVAVQRHHNPLVKVAAHRMLRNRRTNSRPQIAGHADFHWNLPPRQFFHQLRIMPRSQTMSDAFCTKIERAPYRFWPRRLACMRGQPQGVLLGVSVDFAEQLRPGLGFVATDAKSDYSAIFVLDR